MGSLLLSPNWIHQFQSFRSNVAYRKAMMPLPAKLRIKAATISAPWLLLPPAVDGDDMFYKFCTMSEKKSWKKTRDGDEEVPPDNAKLVGSSQGWVASFDGDTNHVFLSNPISGRHIKLPPVTSLPFPEINLLNGRGIVSRLTLTCSSPDDDDDCRAVIIYGPLNWLAYCAPRAATDWTPIGKPYYWFFCSSGKGAWKKHRPYTDFVYSPRQKLLFCLMEHLNDFEGWSLTDPLHPQLHWIFPAVDKQLAPSSRLRNSPSFRASRLEVRGWIPEHPWSEPEDQDRDVDYCYHLHYLVLARHSDQLFHVVRYVVPRLRPDGSGARRVFFSGKSYPNFDYRYPYKTVSFDVFKLDRATFKLTYMAGGSLEGLAMFVGMGDSFALPVADYPHLKPDSIYFTDEDRLLTPSWSNFGGHDNGVFDYRAKAFSSFCDCYPNDYHRIRRIVPPPMWYTPTPTP